MLLNNAYLLANSANPSPSCVSVSVGGSALPLALLRCVYQFGAARLPIFRNSGFSIFDFNRIFNENFDENFLNFSISTFFEARL